MPTPVTAEPYRGRFFDDDVVALGGLELLRAMRERRVADPPVTRLTGLRVTEVGLGRATMAMPATPWWESAAAGVFLAGTLAFVADGPLGGAVMTAAPPGYGMASAGLSVDLVRAATTDSGTIVGRGRLLHSTRTQGIAEVDLEDGSGRLLGHGTSRGMLFPLRSRPAVDLQAAADDDGVPDPYVRPPVGDVLGQEYWDTHTGLEFARAFVAGEVRPPVANLTGIDWVSCDDGTATCSMPRSPWLCNGFGIMYGGALALLVDFALSSALLTRLPAATAYAPLDLRVSFLRPVPPAAAAVVATARIDHLGRNLALMSCEVHDEDGRRVALGSGTAVLLPGRPWTRPVEVGEEQLSPG